MTDKLQQHKRPIPQELLERLTLYVGPQPLLVDEMLRQAYEAGYIEGETNGHEAGYEAGWDAAGNPHAQLRNRVVLAAREWYENAGHGLALCDAVRELLNSELDKAKSKLDGAPVCAVCYEPVVDQRCLCNSVDDSGPV